VSTVSTFRSEPRCRYCATPLTHLQRIAGPVCGHWKCREQHLQAQLSEHRSEAAQALAVAGSDRYPIVVVPSWRPRLVPVTEAERQKLAEHLAGLEYAVADPVTAATGGMAGPPDAEDSPATLERLGRVCGVCRGYCCQEGRIRHAFLQHSTLLRILQDAPEPNWSEAVAVYLSHVPDFHLENGCLYQGESGCVMPRPLRADICNSYECAGLQAAREKFCSDEGDRGFVVVRQDNRIQRSAFLDGMSTRHYDPAAVDEDDTAPAP